MKQTCLIDTNIILRLLIGDAAKQLEDSRIIFKQIEEQKITGLVSILVINELIWIMEHFYKQSRTAYLPQVLQLLSLKNIKIIEVKKRELMLVLEKLSKTNLDFTDIYLLQLASKSNYEIKTFDKKSKKLRIK